MKSHRLLKKITFARLSAIFETIPDKDSKNCSLDDLEANAFL
jgi:hypothetical protein